MHGQKNIKLEKIVTCAKQQETLARMSVGVLVGRH